MPHYFPRSLLALALSLSFFVATPGAQAASEDDDIPASVANAEALPADDASSVEELGVPSDVWERIRRGYAMPVLQSKLVDRWVDFYTKDPAYLRRMSERAGQYLYHIVEEIENRGMPTELALLPFVESAFQAEALSRAKAAGLWQFMPATGKAYDLAQNLWRDDRRDILESTRAALDYFEYLHGMFGDWHLALAAYNWGEGSVQRAIQRAKRRKQPTDYLHLRMPRETANYVPKLEAVKRIISNPSRYGITLPDVGNEPFFVTITKPRDIDIETAAELAGMPLEEFRRLNPSYKLPVIVASHNNVMLLPADKVDFFVDNLASWMDSGQPLSQWTTYRLQQGETLAQVAGRSGMTEDELRKVNGIPKGRRVLANSTLLVRSTGTEDQQDIAAELANAKLQLSPTTTWRRVTYRVRSGDTLSGIARRWRITMKSIVTANRLRSDRLRVGQRLVLTVPNVPRQAIASTQRSESSQHVIHRVRSGETLSTIASRYGVSIAQLKMTNRIRTNLIRPGQRLRIPFGGADVVSDTKIYTVKAGDTLSTIASRYGVSVVRLKRANRLSGDSLRIGDRLEIPTQVAVSDAPKRVAQSRTHRVRSGESLYTIGKRYGVSVDRIKAANGLRRNTIRVGQELVIPARSSGGAGVSEGKVHRVRSGDTLSEIARRYGTTVSKLRSANGLTSNRLRIGQELKIP